MHTPRLRHVPFCAICAALSILGAICLTAGAATAATEGAPQATLWSRPNLPIEGTDVAITFRVPASVPDASAVRIRILNSQGKTVVTGSGPLNRRADAAEFSLSWRPSKNGLYRVEASRGTAPPVRIDLPVIAASRVLDFVWYRYSPWLRWPTVITSATEENAPVLQEHGIKALAWMYGSNHPVAQKGDRPPEAFIAEAEQYYRVPEGFKLDGYGLDEFGGYSQTRAEARAHAWLRGLIQARRQFPEGFVVAAWHGGGVRDEGVGLYKQAADFLLLEAYEMYFVPHELGTENIYADLRGRLIAPRAADLFTRAYGAPCKVLLAPDLCGEGGTYADPGELEQIIRWIRREAPEMRGIAFYNGSGATEAIQRAADRMCFEYFIRPVVTFQQNSVWFDGLSGRPQIVAALSNIGGVDSGAVRVRLTVNGTDLGTRRVERVPAGSSRLSNRAFVRCDWRPKRSGVHELKAEIVAAPGSTVLDASVADERWIAAE